MTRAIPKQAARLRRRGRAGFSLVEVSLALLILAVGLVSILAVFPVAVAWGARSMHDSTGAIAARSVIAQVEDEALNSTAPLTLDTWQQMNVATPGEGGYYVRYQITNSPLALNLRDVQALVYNMDFNILQAGTKAREKAEADVRGVYWGTVYDPAP